MNNIFTKEAVQLAIKLTADASHGLISKQEADKILEKLPEDLGIMVMESVVDSHKKQEDYIKNYLLKNM